MKHRVKKAILLAFLVVLLSRQAVISYAYSESDSSWNMVLRESSIRPAENDEGVQYRMSVVEDDLTFEAEIESFDVSNDRIVIVFSDGTMGLFDKNMKLIKSYRYEPSDTLEGIIINNDNLVLFKTRCDYATEITQNGRYVAMYYAPNDDHEIRKYAYANLRESNDAIYYMLEDEKPNESFRLLRAPYLIREYTTGKTEVLYDAYKYYMKRKTISLFIGIGVVLILIAYAVWFIKCSRYMRELREEYGEDTWVQPLELKRNKQMYRSLENVNSNPLMMSTENPFHIKSDDEEKSMSKKYERQYTNQKSHLKPGNPLNNYRRKKKDS